MSLKKTLMNTVGGLFTNKLYVSIWQLLFQKWVAISTSINYSIYMFDTPRSKTGHWKLSLIFFIRPKNKSSSILNRIIFHYTLLTFFTTKMYPLLFNSDANCSARSIIRGQHLSQHLKQSTSFNNLKPPLMNERGLRDELSEFKYLPNILNFS